jgi:ribosomal subunit interface protein
MGNPQTAGFFAELRGPEASGKVKPMIGGRIMETPLQIKVHNIPASESYESVIREKVDKLASVYDRITHCRVVIDAPHRHRTHGFLYTVRIHLTVPNGEVVVKREPNEDLYVAIRDAFNAAKRQLQDFARRQRGDVKVHEETPVATVAKVFPVEGYGFLLTPDGREIYFHRNSMVDGDFDQLETGAEVRFSEEQGMNGPQASTVSLISASGGKG